jgi:hypothetical protein
MLAAISFALYDMISSQWGFPPGIIQVRRDLGKTIPKFALGQK